MNPLELFQNWFSEEENCNHLKLPRACCLSTMGLDGYPNSRFVSFKEVVGDSLIITGSLNSQKGLEIENNPKVSLTFWWTATERQVRIQGDVFIISKEAANHYFEKRNRDSQIVSAIFKQGQEVESISHLQHYFNQKKEELLDNDIQRPEKWFGIAIHPVRIEFMEFKDTRLHERKSYTKTNAKWTEAILQP